MLDVPIKSPSSAHHHTLHVVHTKGSRLIYLASQDSTNKIRSYRSKYTCIYKECYVRMLPLKKGSVAIYFIHVSFLGGGGGGLIGIMANMA